MAVAVARLPFIRCEILLLRFLLTAATHAGALGRSGETGYALRVLYSYGAGRLRKRPPDKSRLGNLFRRQNRTFIPARFAGYFFGKGASVGTLK